MFIIPTFLQNVGDLVLQAVCLFVCLSVCLFVCLFVCLSVTAIQAVVLDGLTSFLVYRVLLGKARMGLFGDLEGQGQRGQSVQCLF